jgi:hypothetical protein
MRKSFEGEHNPNYRHGLAGSAGLYNSWQNMKQRCMNPNNPKYHRYGGRGVKICDAWLSITGFKKWALANGYSKGMTIDRKDNDGNYCPENCHWISVHENSRKKSSTKISQEDASKIRERIKNGELPINLAIEYNVVHGTIWFIQNNITHVSDGECTKALSSRKRTS